MCDFWGGGGREGDGSVYNLCICELQQKMDGSWCVLEHVHHVRKRTKDQPKKNNIGVSAIPYPSEIFLAPSLALALSLSPCETVPLQEALA